MRIEPSMGSTMTDFCLIGSDRRYRILRSAVYWLSTEKAISTLSYPSPQSGGRVAAIRSGRFVMMRKVRSGRSLMKDQTSGRQASASSIKKSEVVQVWTILSSGFSLYTWERFFCKRLMIGCQSKILQSKKTEYLSTIPIKF